MVITFTVNGKIRRFYRTGPNTAPYAIPGYIETRGGHLRGTLRISGNGFIFCPE